MWSTNILTLLEVFIFEAPSAKYSLQFNVCLSSSKSFYRAFLLSIYFCASFLPTVQL